MLSLSLQNSFKNLWRNRYSSIATILLIAIILFILNIILVVNLMVKNQLTELGQKVNMIVYLQDDVDPSKALAINESIKQLKGVKNSIYISKQEALQNFLKNHQPTAEYFKKFNLENTLPPSIQINVIGPDYYEKIQKFLKASPDSGLMTNIFEDDANKNASITESVTKNLQKLSTFSRTLIFWIITAFLIGSVLIMNNAVHLAIYHRRLEINIMRLVGATPMFIRLPYLLEALWASVIAIALSIGGFLVMTQAVLLPEAGSVTASLGTSIFWLISAEIGATVILTILSSYAAVERHLQKHMILS